MKDVILIGEVKTRSPFGFVSPFSLREQFRYCQETPEIQMISIHTDPAFGGSWEWLEKCCKKTTKPILAKGFHNTPADVQRARDCGASWVLTVGWHPDSELGYCCVHEPASLQEFMDSCADRIMINRRDPHTGETRYGDWMAVREKRDRDCRYIQASMVRSRRQVSRHADAVLVGEHLREYVQSLRPRVRPPQDERLRRIQV